MLENAKKLSIGKALDWWFLFVGRLEYSSESKFISPSDGWREDFMLKIIMTSMHEVETSTTGHKLYKLFWISEWPGILKTFSHTDSEIKLFYSFYFFKSLVSSHVDAKTSYSWAWIIIAWLI